MPQIRHNEQRLEDFSPLLELVERDQNLLERFNWFDKDYLTGTLASFERITSGTDDMGVVARGADRQVAGDDIAENFHMEVPFFTLDKSAKAHEAQDLRTFATADDVETVAKRVTRIVSRIQRSHARVMKKVMYAALKGSTYAVDKAGNPVASLTKTFQSMFNIDNSKMFKGNAGGAANLSLASSAPSPFVDFATFRDHIIEVAQDGIEGGDDYEIMLICGTQAFNAIKDHDAVQEAFANYTDGASLRQRLGGLKNNRVFEHDGLIIMEDRSGQIGTLEGVILAPELCDFQLKFAPADAIGYENTVAEEAYMFMEEGTRKVTVESETSVVACNTRPEVVGRYTFTV
ncbi:putative major capsid protein [Vibrio phage RYC]|nr:putative major capsid protein [Vibrio phage RYC]